MNNPEIAVVGGGIGGSALATVLARKGLSVVVLERDLCPIDRVRDEWMAPWGVTKAASLEILDILQRTRTACTCHGSLLTTKT